MQKDVAGGITMCQTVPVLKLLLVTTSHGLKVMKKLTTLMCFSKEEEVSTAVEHRRLQ